MNLINPNRSIVPLKDDLFFPIEQHFDKFFDQFFKKDNLHALGNNTGFPKINAYEKDGELILSIAVAGMTSKDLKVEVDNENVLLVSGRVSEDYHLPEEAVVHLRELRLSYFERRLQLPKNIEGDPEALVKDGILTLKWKLKVDKSSRAKTRSIPIRSQ